MTVLDLFSGAGGLSEGFFSVKLYTYVQAARGPRFTTGRMPT